MLVFLVKTICQTQAFFKFLPTFEGKILKNGLIWKNFLHRENTNIAVKKQTNFQKYFFSIHFGVSI